MPIEVTNADFEVKVLQADKPVLVDFWAPWCGPCMMMHPILDKIAEKYRERAVVAKVNISDGANEQLAQKYQIRAIPFMAVFQNGEVADTIVGVHSEEDLAASLDRQLDG
jgi:thioredoxin 1